MNTKEILKKYLETEKIKKHLQDFQHENGGYPGLKPDPISSIFFSGILNEIGKKPKYKSTYDWAQALQTGKRGFAEAPGENCWNDRTFWGSEIHKSLEIRPKFEKEFLQGYYQILIF